MTGNAHPVLCGGTFFTLLLEARKPRTRKKEQLCGTRDCLSEPECLAGLLRVMYPEYIKPASGRTFQTNVSEYKLCKNNGGNMPFFDQEIDAFDKRVKTDHQAAMIHMLGFINRFIDVGSSVKRDEWLVKALLDLIESDNSISDDEAFFVLSDGQTLTKADIKGVTNICLPAFMLGIWHFVVVNRRDNKVGRGTIDRWCPANNSSRRVYTGHMGARITRAITLVSFDPEVAVSSDASPDEEYASAPECDETVIEDDAVDSTAASTTQVVNNPVIFNQYGNNNIQIGSIGTLTINND